MMLSSPSALGNPSWFVITAELSSCLIRFNSKLASDLSSLISFLFTATMVRTLTYTLAEPDFPAAAPYQITRRDIPDPSGTHDIR
jgi:hypothetical protein